MYKKRIPNTTVIKGEKGSPGESLMHKMRRILANKEPIKSNPASMIYSERKAGVLPHTDIRTNRWDLAVQGTNLISDQFRGKRDADEWAKEAKANMEKEAQQNNSGGAGGTQATDATK